MDKDMRKGSSGLSQEQRPAIRFLVESALRKVVAKHEPTQPRTRSDWVAHLCDALMSESETSHQAVISAMITSGVTSDDIYQTYIPEAARYLGELWVSDRASFVDVTVGAARLQALFRSRDDAASGGRWLERSIPLGQSVLMVIPVFEQHSLGAFIAADSLRRHGLWVHMAIGLDDWELAQLIRTSRFSMVGISLATPETVEQSSGLVNYLRGAVDGVPPLVIGGQAVNDPDEIVTRTGADHAVRSVREAIDRCRLATVASSLPLGEVAAR